MEGKRSGGRHGVELRGEGVEGGSRGRRSVWRDGVEGRKEWKGKEWRERGSGRRWRGGKNVKLSICTFHCCMTPNLKSNTYNSVHC